MTQGQAHEVLARYEGRGIANSPIRTGDEVKTQLYEQGPSAWVLFLHVGAKAQVEVHASRASGAIRVVAAARRDSRRGMRLEPSAAELAIAERLAARIECDLTDAAAQQQGGVE